MTRQSGVALLALLTVLGLLVAVYVAGFAGNSARSNETDQRTADALAQAKEALIGYSASYRDGWRIRGDSEPNDVFGYLPCPDMSTAGIEGSAETSAPGCASKDVTVIGRLPWRTLGLPPLRDGDGECLWYAVSGNFKANVNKTDLMNWDTNGLIEIRAPDGTNFVAGGSGTTADATMRAAAVIFSPGAILPRQDRTPPGTSPPQICGGNYTASNYLDTDYLEPDVSSRIDNAAAASTTASALSQLIAALNSDRTAATGDVFNDRLAAISPNDIFAARVQKRSDFLPFLIDPDAGMLRQVAECIAWYGTKSTSGKTLPWAASETNRNYGIESNYKDVVGRLSGRLPSNVSNSIPSGTELLFPPPTPLPPPAPPVSCTTNWTLTDKFWSSWKEHVFYALADAHKPGSSFVSAPIPCDEVGAKCLTVDGNGPFAAVIIFAGAKLSGQSRNNDDGFDTSIEKGILANYLEGDNLTAILTGNNIEDPTSDPKWGKFSASFGGGNDTVFCVNKDMKTDPTCSGVSGVTTCTQNASLLANFRDGNDNNCIVGKKALPECKALSDNIVSNKSCSCRKGAKEFISGKCLKGFSSKKCKDAHAKLLGCQ